MPTRSGLLRRAIGAAQAWFALGDDAHIPIGREAFSTVEVDIHDWRDWPTISETWAALVDGCREATLFVSAPWVDAWLATFGHVLEPRIALVRARGGAVIGGCILVRRVEQRGPFAVRRIYLNTAGEDARDSACAEFNSLLCAPAYERTVATALRDYLDTLHATAPWDELAAPGMHAGRSLAALREAFGDLVRTERNVPSHYVDLTRIRRERGTHLDAIGARERARIRRKLAKLARLGEVRVEAATTTAEALAILEELAALHQEAWTVRGQPGAFASRTFHEFHRRLVTASFDAGHIQLVRVRVGSWTLGAVYNFVHRGRTYYYQSGIDYQRDHRLSPGIVLHVYAIQHALALGQTEYDFMAGNADYKRRLATDHRTLHWLVWRASTIKMRTLELVRHTRRVLLARRGG